MIQILEMSDALAYVQSKFPYASARLDDLRGSLVDYISAARSDECQRNCPGIENCKIGIVSRVCLEDTGYGKTEFVVRADTCRNRRTLLAQRRVEQLLSSSRIPAALEPCTLQNFRARENSTRIALSLARYTVESGEGLVLCGPPGTGKSHLAVSIVRAVVASKHKSAIFLPVVNMLDEIKESMTSGANSTMLQALHEVDCLALDDLGMQKDTPWVGERLYEIINHRYNYQKQLIVTTNARNLVDLGSMIGTSGRQIASRLKEMASIHHIDADDYRQLKNGRQTRVAKEEAM